MPKGVPKTEGEKLKDKFDKSYNDMKTNYRRGKSKKKSDCGCKKCKATKT